jgi:minichromosome maintenance protein 10
VPVCGDWITIAVVAERGPIKFTRAPVAVEKMPDEEDEEKKNFHKKGKESNPKPPMGKKYVNIKLVDFGARSKSPGQGSKAVIRGDAFLTLLLFESDGYDTIQEADGRKRRMYKGGSKGAFESMSKLKEGDVVAMLNPKVLKPFQVSSITPSYVC